MTKWLVIAFAYGWLGTELVDQLGWLGLVIACAPLAVVPVLMPRATWKVVRHPRRSWRWFIGGEG